MIAQSMPTNQECSNSNNEDDATGAMMSSAASINSGGSSNRRKQFKPARLPSGQGETSLPLYNMGGNDVFCSSVNNNSSLSPPLSSPASSPAPEPSGGPSALDLTAAGKSPCSNSSDKIANSSPESCFFANNATVPGKFTSASSFVIEKTIPVSSTSTTTSTVDFCPYCKKSFCNKYYLRKHLKDLHQLELPRPPRGQALDIMAAEPLAAQVPKQELGSTKLDISEMSPTNDNQKISSGNPMSNNLAAVIQQMLNDSSPLKQSTLLNSPPSQPPQQQPLINSWLSAAAAAAAAATAATSNMGKNVQNPGEVPQPPLPQTSQAYHPFGQLNFGNGNSSLLRELASAAGISLANQTASTLGNDASCQDLAQRLLSSAVSSATSNNSTNPLVSNKQTVKFEVQSHPQPQRQQTPVHVQSSMNHSNNANTNGSSGTSTINERVECDICHKLVCNKYFLRAHKFKIHHIRDPRLPPKWARIAAEMDRQQAASSQQPVADHLNNNNSSPQQHQRSAPSNMSTCSSISVTSDTSPMRTFNNNVDNAQEQKNAQDTNCDQATSLDEQHRYEAMLAQKNRRKRRRNDSASVSANKCLVLAKARKLAKFMYVEELNFFYCNLLILTLCFCHLIRYCQKLGNGSSSRRYFKRRQEFRIELGNEPSTETNSTTTPLLLPFSIRLPVNKRLSSPIVVTLQPIGNNEEQKKRKHMDSVGDVGSPKSQLTIDEDNNNNMMMVNNL